MKLKPHLLGILVISITASITVFYISKQIFAKSTLTIIPKENKFTVNFNLAKQHKNDISKILEKLGISQSVLEGFNFQLDATSSAALAYISPIKATISPSDNTIYLDGNITRSLLPQNLPIENLRAPKSSNLIVFAPNLLDLILDKTNYSQNLKDWLKLNFEGNNGQYLFVFGSNADFALLAKSNHVDLTTLKNLEADKSGESPYKEEERNGINYHLLNISQAQSADSQTLAIFSKDQWAIFASSPEAAYQVADSLDSNSEFISIADFKVGNTAALVIILRNLKDDPISQDLVDFFIGQASDFNNSQKLKHTIENLEKVVIILKDTKFSGLINIK